MANKTKKPTRLGFAAKNFWKAFRGYDAVKNTRYRANRGNDPIRSEEIELSNYDRDRLVSASLEFRRNNPIVASLSRLRKADVVGRGIMPQPSTGDLDLDKKIEESWQKFSDAPEITGMMDMRELQQQLIDSLLYYGDSGLIFTKSGVQFVDGSRIGNPSGVSTSDETSKMQNGVMIDDFGKPVAYNVGNRVSGVLRDDKLIPAKDFIHFLKRMRPNQYRGVPELAPVLNTLQDCNEYDKVEMMAAKVSASLSVAVKRENSYEFELQNRMDASDQDSIGNLEQFEPGRFHYLEPGEDVSVIGSNGRPNVDGIEWVNYLLRKVGSAVGIPLEFLIMEIGKSSFSASQGVVLQYQQTVESYQSDLIRVMNRLYRRWLSVEAASGNIDISNAATPFLARWQRPAFRWVNRAAQVKADMEYFRAGAMSLDDITAPFGYTAEDVMIRKAQNLSQAKKIAKDFNLGSWYDLVNFYNTSASANFTDLTSQEMFKAQREEADDKVADEPLITSIGVGGVTAISELIKGLGEGLITSSQVINILVSVFGLSEQEAKNIAEGNSATETK
jgi:lambda family phage portal protein